MLLEPLSSEDFLTRTPALAAKGNWLCLNIETSDAWPVEAQAFIFEGTEVWVIPYTSDCMPGLALNLPAGLGRDEAWALLHRALSQVVWLEQAGAVVTDTTGGNLPRMMGGKGRRGTILRTTFDLSDMQPIDSQQGLVALAIMREARGLSHPAYAFLSFFRALECSIPDGKARGIWVTSAIDRLGSHSAKEALAKLRQKVKGDIGKHLRESGRHAIAHAQGDVIINPDDPQDARRLKAELPIIEALAELAIEEHLGIFSKWKIYRDHLYELRGWKKVIGDALIADVLTGKEIPEGTKIDVPDINIRLRKREPYPPLEAMTCVNIGLVDRKFELAYQSASGLVDFVFKLNFQTERLEFDAVFRRDDGSVLAAENARDLIRFDHEYFGNGELQFWNALSGELISRSDAFMPVNAFFNHEAAKKELAIADQTIADRRAAAEAMNFAGRE